MIQAISDEDFRKLTNFIKSQYGITLQQKRQLVTFLCGNRSILTFLPR